MSVLLSLDQQRLLQQSINHPRRVEWKLREARRRIAEASSQASSRFGPSKLTVCVNGAEEFVTLTEMLWDYFRDRESL